MAYRLGQAGPERLVLAHRAPVRTADAWWMRLDELRAQARTGHITRYVGQRGALEPCYRRWDLADGDRLLLCTDGLTDQLSDSEIHALACQPKDADVICRELVRLANERGGEDNITVILVAGPDLPDVP